MRLPDRILSRLIHDPETGCLTWTGCLNSDGYGIVWFDLANHRIHRLIWAEWVGPIPEGKVIDHLCRNRACARPSHLRVVTQRDNVLADGSLSIGRMNTLKTVCPQGHPYTPENTYTYGTRRYCRSCRTRGVA